MCAEQNYCVRNSLVVYLVSHPWFAFLSKLSSVMQKLGLCKSLQQFRLFCQVAFVRLPVGGTRGRLKVGNTANVLPDSATSITSALGPDSSSQLLAPGEPAPSCPLTNMTSNRAVTSPWRSEHQFFRASLSSSQVWRSVRGYGSCFLKSLPQCFTFLAL